MPTQKIFKQRVRARMTKTGESYTAARRQLLRKSAEPATPELESIMTQYETIDAPEGAGPDLSAEPIPPDAMLVPDESMLRATGKGHAEWFTLLDAWGATGHTHTEIARWLSETHSVPGWWTQNVTVAYERARGMRARHQMPDGFSISATRTIAVGPERALAAFTDEPLRERWLPNAPMHRRPTRAARSARFDWLDPTSRIVVTVVPRGDDKTLVAVGHEQLPDAETGERLKGNWREWLAQLKAVLEAS
jgi:uncharacterized protein YndB with AHSA1/START domain